MTKKVCDKDVCDKLCDEEGYDKLCDHTMTWGKRWCVTKLCVKDGVCVWKIVCDQVMCDKVVCERWCVTKRRRTDGRGGRREVQI